MKLSFHLKRNDVNDFLKKVKEKLKTEGTDGFVFIPTRKSEKPKPEFTNSYCLAQLEYDTEDVMNDIIPKLLQTEKVLILVWNYYMYLSKKFKAGKCILK